MPDNLIPENDDSLSLNLNLRETDKVEKKESPTVSEPKPIVIPVEKKQERMILNQNPDRQSIKHKINLSKPPKPKKEKLEIPPILAEVKKVEPTPAPEIEKNPILEMPDIQLDNKTVKDIDAILELNPTPKNETKNPTIEKESLLDVSEIKSLFDAPVTEIIPESKPKPLDLNDFPSIIMKEEDLDLRLELPKKEVKKKENKVEDKVGKNVVAWLILHTENQEPIYFDLFEGVNVIGRGEPKRPADVEIHNDQYVSRFHAYIRIFQTPQKLFLYAIYDGLLTPPKPSLNGVYVNGNKERLKMNDAHYLKDGDTVQIGLTKLVFKSREMMGNVEEAFTQVLETEYTQTVIIK